MTRRKFQVSALVRLLRGLYLIRLPGPPASPGATHKQKRGGEGGGGKDKLGG
jgi:hypothetical protein